MHHTDPSHPVHVVVIPKEHKPPLTDLGGADEGLLTGVVGLVREVAARVEAEHGPCSVITNLGLYQESKDLLWQVFFRGGRDERIPRTYGRRDG
ncbi:hypothetical protein ACF1HJ_43020 [Streptomyces sp. NPDC013978]|uniref:hypothetical protein n=1 Tax=Streptomyces sp. NPDC013978 TaxID=3364869 RepID=UPI0036FCCD8E